VDNFYFILGRHGNGTLPGTEILVAIFAREEWFYLVVNAGLSNPIQVSGRCIVYPTSGTVTSLHVYAPYGFTE
jgi:hypothetical protein